MKNGFSLPGDRLLTLAVVASTAAAAVAGVLKTVESTRLPEVPGKNRPRIIEEWRRYSGSGSRVGPANPAVTVVVFSDYLCGHCQVTASVMRELGRRFPEEVAIVWRHYPLFGLASFDAAVRAECARRAGRFLEMHDLLFAAGHSGFLDTAGRMASAAGVQDTLAFAECLLSEEASAIVRQGQNVAEQLQIRGKPAVLVDSLLFRGSPREGYLKAYVGIAAKRSRRASPRH